MKFKEYLEEQKENHAVLAFGRMNPPTTGHAKLVDKVKEIAKDVGGSHHIVLSHSQDPNKNPLSPEQKVKYAKIYFPNTNISTSDKEHPNFLSQASKLHKAGVTHLHMVAGSDRTGEYKKILHKYNGVRGSHGYYNFKNITIHSAGERDPDSEGVEGMSGSKMREQAAKGNFKEFKKGVPSHVSVKDSKDLYNSVRKGMGIKESFESIIQDILLEGVHDKGIFKAMFLAGGPGSGKDYVLDNTLSGHGLTEINSDKALEFLMDKKGLDKKMPESEKEMRNVIRGRAKDVTELRQRLALLGRNGLIINGTGDDPKKIERIKKALEDIGYETGMVMVNTRDEVSQERNIKRGQSGGRTVPEEIRKEKWDAVQAARPKLAKLFGDKYTEFENSEDLRTAPEEVKAAKKQEMLDIFKNVQEFVAKPAEHPSAKQWIAGELSKKDRLGVPKQGVEKVAPPGDTAADEARKLGLQYYGYGRYGKNGKVTHHSVHGKLVQDPVHIEQQKQEKKASAIPVSSSSQPTRMKESLDSDFCNLFESVTISVTADSLDELNKTFKMLTGNGKEEQEVEEQKTFTDTGAFNALTLGKPMMVSENYNGMKSVKSENGSTYISLNNKPRVYMLRNAAAVDAHQHNGQVVKHKNGYMVKLKENENVELSKEFIQTEEYGRKTSIGWTGQSRRGEIVKGRRDSSTITEHCGCESGSPSSSSTQTSSEETKPTKTKNTIAKIKENFRQKINEIDKGIEPGMSMSAGGESIGRDMGEISGKDGKASPLKKKPIKELTGDETGASIGDQKEDELKKQGISLSSFKKRNYL